MPMYVFCFFREFAPALHLAISSDLLTWKERNEEMPILESKVGAGYWRDPFIIQATDGIFHLLCTDGWSSPDIVHASSHDLLEWSEQDVIHVMQEFHTARNSWAPEAVYDRETREYYIFWSSTVGTAFLEPKNKPSDYKNHRIYACATTDFKSFSKTRLFFDPGFNCIDASINHEGKTYLMAFKDERGNDPHAPGELTRKHILVATSPSLDGPWKIQDKPVSKTILEKDGSNGMTTWAEGPCVFWNQRSREWWIFYEYFRSQRYGAVKSKDGARWETVDALLSFPPGVKHGTVFEVHDAEIIRKLKILT
nr:glycoside hydrolase family 43 protein [Candidatus Sigynarchaeota archaeon]